MSNYTIGIIYDPLDTRVETNNQIRNLIDFFKKENNLENIDCVFVSNDVELVSNLSKFNQINVWITAIKNISTIYGLYFQQYSNKLLISVCDDNFELRDAVNIIHLNNSSIAQVLQLLKVVYNYLNSGIGISYQSLEIFYDNEHIKHMEYFRANYGEYNNRNLSAIYTNISNGHEYDSAKERLKNSIQSKKINNINTLFIYLTSGYECFFKIFSIVEIPLSINNDINIIGNIRHICYSDSYINQGYVNMFISMVENLIDTNFFGDKTPCVRQIEDFFESRLRMVVFSPILSRYEAECYDYLSYIFYIKNPVDIEYLISNRITIYSVLIEKALKIAHWLVCRNITGLGDIQDGGILMDGKTFGPINYRMTHNPVDNYWYNRLVLNCYQPKNLYYLIGIDPDTKIDRGFSLINFWNLCLVDRKSISKENYKTKEQPVSQLSLSCAISCISDINPKGFSNILSGNHGIISDKVYNTNDSQNYIFF
jgi:hypothetical protein